MIAIISNIHVKSMQNANSGVFVFTDAQANAQLIIIYTSLVISKKNRLMVAILQTIIILNLH